MTTLLRHQESTVDPELALCVATSASVLEVLRDRPLGQTRIISESLPEPGPGQLLLSIDRFGLSANNLTYALLGDMLGHWAPFPAADGWGRVPVWGAATVVAGDPEAASAGARFVGYLPMASHVLVRAVAAHPGLRDVSTERSGMLPLYREMRRVDTDPAWSSGLLDAEVLMQPVYPAAGMLDEDLRRSGAHRVVISSASSKTSLGVARLLVERGVHVTGLSDRSRAAAAASAVAYEQVLPYDDLAALAAKEETTYVDVAGDPEIARSVAERLGSALKQHIAVGGSHLAALGGLPAPSPAPSGPAPVRFSIGQRLVEVTEDFGRAELDRIEQNARRILVPWADRTFRVTRLDGLDAASEAWRRMGARTFDALDALDAVTVTP